MNCSKYPCRHTMPRPKMREFTEDEKLQILEQVKASKR